MSASSDNWSLSRIRWQGNTLPECCHGKQTQMNQMDWPCTFQRCLKMDTIWQQETWWTKVTWHLPDLNEKQHIVHNKDKIRGINWFSSTYTECWMHCRASPLATMTIRKTSQLRWVHNGFSFLQSESVKIVILIAKLIDFKFRIIAVYKCTVF